MATDCPNCERCVIIHNINSVSDNNRRLQYIETYCKSPANWLNCKRYNTKKAINMCPDFVMPDDARSIDDIIEIIEAEL